MAQNENNINGFFKDPPWNTMGNLPCSRVPMSLVPGITLENHQAKAAKGSPPSVPPQKPPEPPGPPPGHMAKAVPMVPGPPPGPPPKGQSGASPPPPSGDAQGVWGEREKVGFRFGLEVGSGGIWVFPKIVIPPKHPKIVIFSRKTNSCWLPPF